MLNCVFTFTTCCNYGCSSCPCLWDGEIGMLLVVNSPCLERKTGANRSSWRRQLVQAVPDYIPQCSPKSCRVVELAARSRTWRARAALCVIPAFMQPQLKMLSWPEESKGLFISSFDKSSLLLPHKAVKNASQCLIWRHLWSEDRGVPHSRMEVVWKQISPEKAFSGAPWRQCSNLLPCAGDGRLRRDVAHSTVTPSMPGQASCTFSLALWCFLKVFPSA